LRKGCAQVHDRAGPVSARAAIPHRRVDSRVNEGLRRSRLLRVLGGFVIVWIAITHDLGLQPIPTLGLLDLQIYDGRQVLRQPTPDPRIVIVDIDERSLAEQGRWPWPRAQVAELADTIFELGGAAVVGFDTVFVEPETNSNGDEQLAEALRMRPSVLGYYLSSGTGRRSGSLPPPVLESAELALPRTALVYADGYGANLEVLSKAAAAQGFFNPFVGAGIDIDGAIRALPLLASYKDSIHESFVVAVLRQYLNGTALTAGPDFLRLQGRRGEVRIPVSTGYTAMVPYAGPGGAHSGRFPYISASDVLQGQVDWSIMRDRIVLIGTSAPGLTDLRATPVNEVFPGVEIHASLIAGALDGDVRRRPAEAGMVGALASTVLGGALALALPTVGPVMAALACAMALLTIIGANAIAYSNLGLVLPMAATAMAVLLITAFNLLFGYLAEGRARRAVIRLFGEYLSPDVVEQMARDPERWRAAASMDREITILFADIRGFTRMAESMEPAVLREYLNAVLTALTNVIHAHEGTVDKYIGDAVMAFWGAPLEDPSHADHAVDAALEMQREVERLSADFVARGLPPLLIGIGINTGVVRVGDMGSAVRRTYTAIGDAVNLASRLERLTKRYELPIIVGEATARGCREHVFDAVGDVSVEGRSNPVGIWVPRVPEISRHGRRFDKRHPARPVADAPAINIDRLSGALNEGAGPRM
jgi:adenylate cyclase